jgi:hypothetical protein
MSGACPAFFAEYSPNNDHRNGIPVQVSTSTMCPSDGSSSIQLLRSIQKELVNVRENHGGALQRYFGTGEGPDELLWSYRRIRGDLQRLAVRAVFVPTNLRSRVLKLNANLSKWGIPEERNTVRQSIILGHRPNACLTGRWFEEIDTVDVRLLQLSPSRRAQARIMHPTYPNRRSSPDAGLGA